MKSSHRLLPGEGTDASHWKKIVWGVALSVLVLLLAGCSTIPANEQFRSEDEGLFEQVMARKDKIVHLTPRDTVHDKPVLIILHGATDDPTEMVDIFSALRSYYDVFLYSYNYHESIEKVGSHLAEEVKRLEAENNLVSHATVITFSYSAIVFRQAVINPPDESLFSSMSLVQLVPTAGGSMLARWMRNPVFGPLASLASKPSAAENPYGQRAKQLFGKGGNKKFSRIILPERTCTVVLEGDPHSLASVKNKKVQEHYRNGIGTNVVTIPKSAGVSHEFLPTQPAAQPFLIAALETLHKPPGLAESRHVAGYPARQTTVTNRN